MSVCEILGLSALGGYILGSIPFGLVLCYLAELDSLPLLILD